MKKTILLWLVTCCLASSVCAQQRNRLGVPDFQHYPTNVYAAFNQIWSVRQDQQGLLYFAAGGEGNILQFDGQRWRKAKTKQLGGAFSLDVDPGGRVWVGAYSDCGYFDVDSAGRPVYRSIISEFPDSMSALTYFWTTVALDQDDIFFCAFGGIVRYHKSQISYIKPGEGKRFFFMFKSDSTFMVYMPDHGLCVWDRNRESLVPIKGGEYFATIGASAILPWKNGEKLVVTRKSGCYRFDPVSGSTEKLQGDWPGKDFLISGAIRLTDGTFLLHSINAGLMILDGEGNLQMHVTTDDGLPTNNIKSAVQAADGTIWFGTENGIVKGDLTNPLSRLRDGHGIDGSVVSFQKFDGAVFVGSTQGLYKVIPDANEKALMYLSKVPSVAYRTGVLDTAGGLLAVGGAGFTLYDRKMNVRHYDDYVTQAICKVKGLDDVWMLGGRHQFIRFDLKSKTRKMLFELHDEILSINQETTIPRDSLIFWVGFYTRGTARIVLSPAGETGYISYGTMPSGYTILTQATGHLSALTMKGLFRPVWTGGAFNVTADSAMGPQFAGTGRGLFQVAHMDSGYWVLSGGHIMKTSFENGFWQLDSSLYYNIDMGETVFFPDGDRLWIGGTDGLVLHRRDRPRDVYRTYSTLVRSVRIKGDSLIFSGNYADIRPGISPDVVSYELNTFTMEFSASDYIDVSRLEFSWKLEGFDEDWTSWTTDNRVTYTNLNEGSYTFRVRSRNLYQTVGKEGLYRFKVSPPWYRTWWFRLTLLLAMSLLLWAIYQYRVNRLLAVERLRVKIASDLHDDIGANLSKISMYADLVQHESRTEESNDMLSKIGDLSRRVISSMSDIVWSIDSRSDKVEDLVHRMNALAHELFDSGETQVSVSTVGMDTSSTLPILIKQNFYLIYKEALNNILKYADATRVTIELKQVGRTLSMTIVDNGSGMKQSSGLGGNGLKNMRMRAQALKGTLQINDNAGVEIRVSVPVQ